MWVFLLPALLRCVSSQIGSPVSDSTPLPPGFVVVVPSLSISMTVELTSIATLQRVQPSWTSFRFLTRATLPNNATNDVCNSLASGPSSINFMPFVNRTIITQVSMLPLTFSPIGSPGVLRMRLDAFGTNSTAPNTSACPRVAGDQPLQTDEKNVAILPSAQTDWVNNFITVDNYNATFRYRFSYGGVRGGLQAVWRAQQRLNVLFDAPLTQEPIGILQFRETLTMEPNSELAVEVRNASTNAPVACLLRAKQFLFNTSLLVHVDALPPPPLVSLSVPLFDLPDSPMLKSSIVFSNVTVRVGPAGDLLSGFAITAAEVSGALVLAFQSSATMSTPTSSPATQSPGQGTTATPAPAPSPTSNVGGKITIVLIVVGVVLLIGGVVGVVVCLTRRKQRRQTSSNTLVASTTPTASANYGAAPVAGDLAPLNMPLAGRNQYAVGNIHAPQQTQYASGNIQQQPDNSNQYNVGNAFH